MKTYVLRFSALGIALLILILHSCSSDDPESADCSTLSVTIPDSGKQNPSDCSSANGSITATATGGKEPYQYSLNGGAFQSNSQFVNLGAGEYSVTVKDANGCEFTSNAVALSVNGVTINFTATTADSGCKTGEGSMTIMATGGSGDYSYKVGSADFGAATTFNNLTAGAKAVTVRDNSNNCTVTKSIMIQSGTSYASDVKSIIETSCAVSGCHVSGGAAPFSLGSLANIQNHAGEIKTATANGSMPKSGTPLTQAQKDKIACWVDDGAPNN